VTYLPDHPAFVLMLQARPQIPRCGRPTKAGAPCKSLRMPTPHPNPSGWTSPACAAHAMAEERKARIEAHKATADLFEDYQRSLPVACWDWPVTPEHQARAESARTEPDPDAAESLAWDLLVDWQDDRCAVCGGRRGAEVLDHDHATALVRGWLCRGRNLKEGHASGDAPPAARYRSRNPASILGVRIAYRSSWGAAEPAEQEISLDNHPTYDLAKLLLPSPESLRDEPLPHQEAP
jgi:hypothetical protein